ncbi:MAG: isoprenylcysteine carboxylmethyltransferase family protein [Oscillospiraceae bacterium]|nr:isoprenylcysteine carboxylmethyltransferase family protein [Oscillospiraceae bacterium]
MKLLAQAILKFALGVVLTGLLLFLPAGGFGWPNGWLLCAILFLPMFGAGLVMWKKSPRLLEKRLKAKEEEGTQRKVVSASALLFIAGFVVAGLDYRFGWSHLPNWVVIAAAVVFLCAYGLYAEVLRENAYLSRTIEVQEGQKVVDTGLYGIVRHPMYAAVILLFLSIPLVLGSVWAFLIFLPFPALLAARIKNEEAVLLKGLEGYTEYTRRVRWRLFPFVW